MLTQASARADCSFNFRPIHIARLSEATRVLCFMAVAWGLTRSTVAGEPGPWSATIIAALCLFALYALVLRVCAARNPEGDESSSAYQLDSLWYLGFTGLTGGTDSAVWLFLAVPIFGTALREGSAAAVTMAAFSAVGLFLLGALTVEAQDSIGADLLLTPALLLLCSYAIARSVDSGSLLGRKHAAFNQIDRLFSSRMSIDQLMDKVVNELAGVYPIRSYALVVAEPGSTVRLFRATLPQAGARSSERTAIEMSRSLLAIDMADGIAIGANALGPREIELVDLPASIKPGACHAGAVAAELNCLAFCAIEFDVRQDSVVRLFLCADEHCFGSQDLHYFEQLRQQLSPRLENLQLLDRLAREVVEEERRRLSRDVHDSAIQPYIGLKFALEALARRVSPADPLSDEIGRLVEMTAVEIAELRRFVKGLRGQGKPDHASVVPVVHRQAARFGELYGIRVNVEATGDFGINETLAAEVFHIVSEGLSNIRRHTAAVIAHIKLSCDMHKLTVQFLNPCDAAAPAKMFVPRSISERASALGGACRVEINPDHGTLVGVEIPLRQ